MFIKKNATAKTEEREQKSKRSVSFEDDGRDQNRSQGTPGFEPGTSRSAVECSTTELYPHMHASVSTPDLQRPQHARVGGDWVGDRGRWPRRPTRSDRLARRDGYKRRGGGRWGRYDFPARLPGRRKQRRRTHYIGGT